MTQHAVLSASSAERWLACPPSVRLGESIQEKPSKYAEEGTVAHAVAEFMLRQSLIGVTELEKAELTQCKENPLYSKEMLTYAGEYVDTIQEIYHSYHIKPYFTTETRVDFSEYVPDGFGTADCIVIGGGRLNIIDYKFGKGVQVSAEDNPQMKLYALGALDMYGFIYPIETVTMTVVQPRIDNITSDTITVPALKEWGESIKPIAQMAYNGEGEFSSGEHCRFCKAADRCRERANRYSALEDFGYKVPPLLSDEEVGQVLKKAESLKKWCEGITAYALNACLDGKEIPGFKAVEGKSCRTISDYYSAIKAIVKSGIDEAMLYKRVPIQLTAMEELVGKKELPKIIGEYLIKPKGKPTLAQEKDKRTPVTRSDYNSNAQDDFNDNFNNEEI